jgi:uncharacterized repeat protein (TIGR03803 family)
VHNFTGGIEGSDPAGVVRDSAGDLYGTANGGGTTGYGVVYKLDADGNYTVLHVFKEGTGPNGVILTADGLYGTTLGGGTANDGVVYKLDASAHYTVLHNFTGGSDGKSPYAGVIRDSAGNLYGTTYSGGTAGRGLVYKLDTAGNYTVLYNFTILADGANPRAGVVRSPAGDLVGTTEGGGNGGFGVVFVLTGVQ